MPVVLIYTIMLFNKPILYRKNIYKFPLKFCIVGTGIFVLFEAPSIIVMSFPLSLYSFGGFKSNNRHYRYSQYCILEEKTTLVWVVENIENFHREPTQNLVTLLLFVCFDRKCTLNTLGSPRKQTGHGSIPS